MEKKKNEQYFVGEKKNQSNHFTGDLFIPSALPRSMQSGHFARLWGGGAGGGGVEMGNATHVFSCVFL